MAVYKHVWNWKAMADPIAHLLNEPEDDERDRLTLKWRHEIQSQLNVILVISALIASVVASSLTWPDFALPTGSLGTVLTIVKALWFSALLFSIVAIASAAQLAMGLSRIAAYSTDLKYTRRMLASLDPRDPARSTTELSYSKLWMWQIPAVLLNWSTCLYVLGLTILVYEEARSLLVQHVGGGAAAILVIFTLSLTCAVGTYVYTWAGLYHWVGQACAISDRPPCQAAE